MGMTCGSCGVQLHPDVRFCTRCGQRTPAGDASLAAPAVVSASLLVDAPPSTSPPPPVIAPSGRSRLVWVAGLFLVLLVAALIGGIAIGNQRGTSTPAAGRSTGQPSGLQPASPSHTPSPSQAASPSPSPASTSPAAAAYSTVDNARFGFSCAVPSDLLGQETPGVENGFGYQSVDGQATIACSGDNNASLEGGSVGTTTPAQAYEHALASHRALGDSVTYHAIFGNAITVSGIRADNGWIYYDRILWGSGSVDTLRWVYSPALKDQYQAAVEHSAATFRSGDLSFGH